MLNLSPKQSEFCYEVFDHTLDVAEGSPRSGKTFASIARFALHLNASRDTAHLITAYSAEQAYRLIIEGDGYGLQHLFARECSVSHDDSGAHLKINTPTGQKRVYWKGGGKADSHKSITGMSLGSVYFCEIDLLHPDMIQECFRRTYAAKDRWHIADLNPPSPMHPVIKDVFEVQDTRWTHWTCKDNPILTPERLAEIEATCKRSPFLYKRDWLGERCIPEGVIYFMFDTDRHVKRNIPAEWMPVEMFFAGDGGTTDATSIGCYVVCIKGGEYLKKKEYALCRVGNWHYDGGQMAMSDQARKIVGDFIPYMRRKYGQRETNIFIDPACKALRLEIEKLGLSTNGADNNNKDIRGTSKGIKVGIEMLQSAMNDDRFCVVEDERFGIEPFLREVGLYCMDTHGNPVDAYNHCMDETRYASNYFLKTYGLWG